MMYRVWVAEDDEALKGFIDTTPYSLGTLMFTTDEDGIKKLMTLVNDFGKVMLISRVDGDEDAEQTD